MGLSWFFSALADLSWKELLVFTSFTAGTCFFFHILTATKKEPDKLNQMISDFVKIRGMNFSNIKNLKLE